MKPITVIGVLFYSLFASSEVFASEIYKLDRSLNVRSSNTNFISTESVIGHASKGTEFTVLSRKKLQSGAEALEIEIVSPGQGSALPKVKSTPFYIYQSKNKKFQNVAPSSATEAGSDCADGSCYQSASQVQMNSQHAVQTARDIVAAVEEQVSTPTEKMTDENLIQNQIQRYSESASVQKMVSWSMKNITRLSGAGQCYKKTKRSLAAGGLIDSHYDDKYARDAADSLAERGFVNLNTSPYNLKLTPETAPKGAVLVYRSRIKCDKTKNTGRTMDSGCGHIEIKLGDGSDTKGFKYSSDYKNKESILAGSTGDRYELAAVMIKPNL